MQLQQDALVSSFLESHDGAKRKFPVDATVNEPSV
jgi:hypothetical protein